jgi:hypothetical protein
LASFFYFFFSFGEGMKGVEIEEGRERMGQKKLITVGTSLAVLVVRWLVGFGGGDKMVLG